MGEEWLLNKIMLECLAGKEYIKHYKKMKLTWYLALYTKINLIWIQVTQVKNEINSTRTKYLFLTSNHAEGCIKQVTKIKRCKKLLHFTSWKIFGIISPYKLIRKWTLWEKYEKWFFLNKKKGEHK